MYYYKLKVIQFISYKCNYSHHSHDSVTWNGYICLCSTTDATGMSVEYTSTQGVILIPDSKYKLHIAISTVKIGPSVAIKAGK